MADWQSFWNSTEVLERQIFYFENAKSSGEIKDKFFRLDGQKIEKPNEDELKKSYEWIKQNIKSSDEKIKVVCKQWLDNLEPLASKLTWATEIINDAKLELASIRIEITTKEQYIREEKKPDEEEKKNIISRLLESLKENLNKEYTPEALIQNIEFIQTLKDPISRTTGLQYIWTKFDNKYSLSLEDVKEGGITKKKIKVEKIDSNISQEDIARFENVFNSALDIGKLTIQDIQQAIIFSSWGLSHYFNSKFDWSPSSVDDYYKYILTSHWIDTNQELSIDEINENSNFSQKEKSFLVSYKKWNLSSVNFEQVKQNYQESMKIYDNPELKKTFEKLNQSLPKEEQIVPSTLIEDPNSSGGKPLSTMLWIWLWIFALWYKGKWQWFSFWEWLKRIFFTVIWLMGVCWVAGEWKKELGWNLCSEVKNFVTQTAKDAIPWAIKSVVDEAKEKVWDIKPQASEEVESPAKTEVQQKASDETKNIINGNEALKTKYDNLPKKDKWNASLDDYLNFINTKLQDIKINTLINETGTNIFSLNSQIDQAIQLESNMDISVFKEVLRIYLFWKYFSFEELKNYKSLINDKFVWEETIKQTIEKRFSSISETKTENSETIKQTIMSYSIKYSQDTWKIDWVQITDNSIIASWKIWNWSFAGLEFNKDKSLKTQKITLKKPFWNWKLTTNQEVSVNLENNKLILS